MIKTKRILAFFFAILALVACADDGDGAPADSDTACQPGDTSCAGDIRQVCEDESWTEAEDCAASDKHCIAGACLDKPDYQFLAERHEIAGETTVTLDFLTGAAFLLVPYYMEFSSTDAGYEIQVENAEGEAPAARARTLRETALSPARARLEARIAGERPFRLRDRLRFAEAGRMLAQTAWPRARAAGDCSASAECAEDELCDRGRCADVVSLHFDGWSIHEDFTAQVALKGERCAILVDTDFAGQLDGEDATLFLDACERVVMPRNRMFFGEPTITVGEQTIDVGDRDRDGLLQVLFSRRVNEENVWGFFNSVDFYHDEPNFPSNERDILYVSLPVTASERGSIMATIIHEYQHLLHFAIRAYGPELLGETGVMSPVWFDEALAHLAEEIGGYGVDNVELVRTFFDAFDAVSLAYDGDTLNQRAMGMLLMLYLFEQAGGAAWGENGVEDLGGAAFLRELLAGEHTGFAGLEDALGRPFEELYYDWLIAVLVDGAGLSDDPRRNYQPVIVDPVTGHEIGVVTHGERMLSTGESVLLNGPFQTSLSAGRYEGVVSATGANVLRVGGYAGPTALTVTGPSEAFYLGVLRIE
ncbi:MAG: hypothetical protein C4523_09300 [Myxococcales bacterium]|nr:MAG: hypothetical protein C4523_09300 [Myxococcales bacterium]